MKIKRLSGFTLIEMLVVVAIILVLAAMGYPIFSMARESGRTAQCSSNLHQLQLAAMNYATDNGGKMPEASCGNWYLKYGEWVHPHGWVAWTDSSKCNDKVLHANGVYAWFGEGGKASIANGSMWEYVKGGYGVYLCPTFAMKANCGVGNPWRSYSMNASASSFDLIAGAGQITCVLFGDDKSLVGVPTADSVFSMNDLARFHRGKAAVVYVDGHVDKL